VVTTATDLPTTSFLGLDFVNASNSEIASELDRMSRSGRFALVATPNVDHIVMLNSHPQDDIAKRLQHAIAGAALLACDSRVLQTLALFRGVDLRVATGSDLTAYLFQEGHLDGRSVALIGGDDAMLKELTRRFPAIALTQHIPPMGVLNNEAAIKAIEDFIACHAFDYIFFAIGAPRSEIIAHRCSQIAGTVGVALCIGASIEFLIGRKARAPRWVQSLRMEWLFRLLSEPRRLWRRYLVTGPRILWIVRKWQGPSAG
jgi:N-acetylglucosaminyldiphosphoundecaprenol N-acetyl-beta-D-mannosaminyltransferase